MIKAIFFDLDNTLYDQALYFSSGFTAISEYLSRQYSLLGDEVFSRLLDLLKTKGSMYTNLFDDLLENLNMHDKEIVNILIYLFHNAPVTDLSLYGDAEDVLPRLSQKYLLGLITNGNSGMQRRKVAALNLNRLLKIQVYTADIGFPKPNPQGYEYAVSMAGIKPSEGVYVGDNPYIDFEGSHIVGMWTVRLLRGEFMNINGRDAQVNLQVRDFYELEKRLQTFNRTV